MTLKNLVRETEVWSLPDRVKNLNADVRRPSKLPLINERQMPELELLASRSPQIQWCGPEGGEFRFLTSDADVKGKKLNSPFRSAPSYAAIRKVTNLTPVFIVYQ